MAERMGKNIKRQMQRNLAKALNREAEKTLAARVPESLHDRLTDRLRLNGHTLVEFITACAQAYIQEDGYEDPRH